LDPFKLNRALFASCSLLFSRAMLRASGPHSTHTPPIGPSYPGAVRKRLDEEEPQPANLGNDQSMSQSRTKQSMSQQSSWWPVLPILALTVSGCGSDGAGYSTLNPPDSGAASGVQGANSDGSGSSGSSGSSG